MKVLLIASECAPFVKVGGIADVIGSLPPALSNLGIDSRVVIPYYSNLKATNTGKLMLQTKIQYNRQTEIVNLYELETPDKTRIYMIGNDKYIGNGGIYFSSQYMENPEQELDRFAFFSKAVCQIFSRHNDIFYPEVFHCNDWHTGLIPQILQTMHNYDNDTCPKTIFTIHNLAYQGLTKLDIADKLGLDIKRDQTLRWDASDNNLDMILQGIIGADFITTVSQKYSEEIQTAEFGEGLHYILQSRKDRLIGILNGISYEVFDPSSDPYIKAKYTINSVNKLKKENKTYLQNDLGLKVDANIPLIGIISRLADQKGLNLVSSSIMSICETGCQVVLLGTGDPKLEAEFKAYNSNASLKGKYIGLIEFSEELARRIYASADMFLIPSKYEPCGLTQMIAMRYGSVPIVRATGGLYDTVSDNKTGFTFIEFSSDALLQSVSKAVETYHSEEKWSQIVKNCMSQDFSWGQSAAKYTKLYNKVIELQRSG